MQLPNFFYLVSRFPPGFSSRFISTVLQLRSGFASSPRAARKEFVLAAERLASTIFPEHACLNPSMEGIEAVPIDLAEKAHLQCFRIAPTSSQSHPARKQE